VVYSNHRTLSVSMQMAFVAVKCDGCGDSCKMVAWLAETIALDVTCSCHQKPSYGKQRVWWLAPPCSSSRVCLFLGESAGRNQAMVSEVGMKLFVREERERS
jgi:hypothetical protein